MCRKLSILLMLLAQAIATIAPVGLVRCVAADGHECIEIVGQECHCCPLSESHEDVDHEAESACCRHCSEEDEACHSTAHDKHESVSVAVNGADCGCDHTPCEIDQFHAASQQVDLVAQWTTFVGLNGTCFDQGRPVEQFCLRDIPLRPSRSPHLIVVATTVLRV